ncbi:MAG: GNAT family N-acetyltransferase [Eubacterium sp.]|nr:GNAT family N-acetyltransferase [Eubacterium sp.]
MNCYEFLPDEELLYATAPSHIADRVMDEKQDTLLLGGFEEGNLISYAVFSHPLKTGREVWLDYLYTAESCRENGVATELLTFAEEYLGKMNITDILVRVLTEPETAKEYHHFFTTRKYIPLSLTGRCMLYKYKDMLDPGAFQLLEKKKALLPPVIRYGDVDKKLLSRLPIRIEEEDKELSFFLVLKGELYGMASASLLDSNTVCIKEIWLNDDARKKGLFLPMLHAVTEEAKNLLSEDMWLCLYLKDEAAYHGLGQMFNPPEQEYLVQEYVKCLFKRS